MKKVIKKAFKYIIFLLVFSTIVGGIFMIREGKRMYGGLTKLVDPSQFHPFVGPLAIKDINILSPDGNRMIALQTLLIENGLIKAIDSSLNIPAEVKIIDGKGKYLIPGLIDAHVHLFQSPNDLLLYLANGITEIREMIGEEIHLKWRNEIKKGRIGPRIFVSTPRLGSFDIMEGWFMHKTQGYLNIRNADHATKVIKRLQKKGYDGIKIYSQLNKESYKAISEIASSLNMPFYGHIPWDLTFSDIWIHGQCGIAHFEEVMNALSREYDNSRRIGSFKGKEEEFLRFINERSEELAKSLIDNNIAITSTLWLTKSFVGQRYDLEQILSEVELEYENPGISEWVSYIPGGLGWLPEVNRYKIMNDLNDEEKFKDRKYWNTYSKACQLTATILSRKGVKIMAGTDANLPPMVPGFSLHDELESLTQAGMSNAEVLKAATVVPANWLGSNSGKIYPGYEANLVLLEKNPLEDIRHTKTIYAVINNGQIFERELLDNILGAVKQANDQSRKVEIMEYSNSY